MKTTHLKSIAIYFSLFLFSSIVQADWSLNNNASTFNFVSVKKASVGEVHTFKDVTGQIDNKGNVLINIKLDSIETLIPIRNERIRSILFETSTYASAIITAKVDSTALNNLAIGSSMQQKVDFSLSLHGKKTALKAHLQVIKLVDNNVLISTVKPFILDLSDYNLIKGIEGLQKIAKLPVISTAVPATVNLIFKKN